MIWEKKTIPGSYGDMLFNERNTTGGCWGHVGWDIGQARWHWVQVRGANTGAADGGYWGGQGVRGKS